MQTVADIERPWKERVAKLEADIAHSVKEAKRREPEYPWQLNTASEAVWALGESLLGTRAALQEWRDRVAVLEVALQHALAEGPSPGNCEACDGILKLLAAERIQGPTDAK